MQKTAKTIIIFSLILIFLMGCVQAEGFLGFNSNSQELVDSPEWVKDLPQAQNESVNQIFIVAGMGMDNSTATISMHERDGDGNWKQLLSTPGFVGRDGLCPAEKHSEEVTQTPIGVYKFNAAFGIADDPGCAIPYTKVNNSTYWSGDSANGMHYNEMVDINDYPNLNMTNSEHIIDYAHEYQYCLNINFNENGTPGLGSAIFLHCFGPEKPYTGGCVAVPEDIMVKIMQNISPDCVVVIDTSENLNASFES